MHAHIQGVAKV